MHYFFNNRHICHSMVQIQCPTNPTSETVTLSPTLSTAHYQPHTINHTLSTPHGLVQYSMLCRRLRSLNSSLLSWCQSIDKVCFSVQWCSLALVSHLVLPWQHPFPVVYYYPIRDVRVYYCTVNPNKFTELKNYFVTDYTKIF